MNYTIQPLGYLHVIISLLYYLPCVREEKKRSDKIREEKK